MNPAFVFYFLMDVLVLGLLFLIGVLFAGVVRLRAGVVEILSLGYPLGAGIVTWSMFILSLLGLHLDRSAGILILAGTTGLLIAVMAVRGSSSKDGGAGRSLRRLQSRHFLPFEREIVVSVIVVTLLVAGWLSVGRSYSTYDATAGWAVKGYGIALEGDVRAGSTWGIWGLAYPQNIPLQIALFEFLDGDLLPGSKMIFPVYFVSLLLACYGFWMKNRVSQPVRVAGLLFLAANPALFLNGTLGFANLPCAVYLVLGVIYGLSGVASGRKVEIMISGLLLGLACWTRPEGIVYAAGCVAVLIVASPRLHRRPRIWLLWLIPIALIATPWLALSADSLRASQLGTATGGVWSSVLDGDYNLNYLAMTFTIFLERAAAPDNWGFFVPMMIVFCVFGFAQLSRAQIRETITFAVLTVIVAILPFAFFYVRSFTRTADFGALLIRSFDRAFIPGAVMLILLCVLVAGREDQGGMPQEVSAASNRQENASAPQTRLERSSLGEVLPGGP